MVKEIKKEKEEQEEVEVIPTAEQIEQEKREAYRETIYLMIDEKCQEMGTDNKKNLPWSLWGMFFSSGVGNTATDLADLTIGNNTNAEALIDSIVFSLSIGTAWLQEILHHGELTEEEGK